MLILTRSLRPGLNRVFLDLPSGERITLEFVEVRFNTSKQVDQVKIGIDAPRGVVIAREEVARQKESEGGQEQ